MNTTLSSPPPTRPDPAARPAAGALAGQLPAVEPSAARLSRLVHDRRFGPWLDALLGGPRGVATTSVGPAVARTASSTRLVLAFGGGRLEIDCDMRAWPALEMASALPDPGVACEVAEALLQTLTARLQTAIGPISVERIVRMPTPGRAPLRLAYGPVRIDLADIDDDAAACIDRAFTGASSAALVGASHLKLPVRLRLFTQALALDELTSLAPGDVVLAPAACQPNGTWRGVVSFGEKPGMQADSDIDSANSRTQLTQAPRRAPDDAETMPTALDTLVLPVAFEIDRARVTLGELAALGEGSVLTLDAPLLHATVRLVCHGQTVGLGQLVAVGDRLGVRIGRMGLHAASPGLGDAAVESDDTGASDAAA